MYLIAGLFESYLGGVTHCRKDLISLSPGVSTHSD